MTSWAFDAHPLFPAHISHIIDLNVVVQKHQSCCLAITIFDKYLSQIIIEFNTRARGKVHYQYADNVM